MATPPVAFFLAMDELYIAGPFASEEEATKHLNKCIDNKELGLASFRHEGIKYLVPMEDIELIADSGFYQLDNPYETLRYDQEK